MKKFSIAALSIICYTQQIQSMELTTPPSNDNGYTIIYKDISERPQPTPIVKTYNALSEKLYDKNITDSEIRELVAKGAKVNYQRPGNNGPVIFNFACDDSPQGIKNMQTMIELGAAIHNIEDEQHTPLTIALEGDGYAGKETDLSAMIQLLITHENPIVTVYTDTYCDGRRVRGRIIDSQEEKIRECLIDNTIQYQNLATIKMLLDLKLITANRGLKTFAYYKDPNQKVLDLLLAYGANNGSEYLPKIMGAAFPNTENDNFTSTQYISFMLQMCASKAFNKDVFSKMLAIKKDVDAIVSLLDANDTTIYPF